MFTDLELVKTQCKIDEDEDDALLDVYIKAATTYCERYTGKIYSARPETYSVHCFGDRVEIPVEPVSSITTVLYTDPEGNEQNMDIEELRLVGSRIYPAIGLSFPEIAHPSLVYITVEIGDDSDDVPEHIQQAALLLIGHWYENRETVAVGTISSSIQMTTKALLDLDRDELS